MDGGGERDMGRRVERGEGVDPGGIAGGAVCRRDRHQPPARRQHREGGADVAQVGVVANAVHARARREGRVHEDDGGTKLRQAVADGLGVVAGDPAIGEQSREQPCAGGGELVEVQRTGRPVAEGALGHDRQHAGAGRGLQHDIAGTDCRGLQRGVGERQRRRELLVLELLLGAPRLGGFQGREGLQHAEHGGGASGRSTGLAPHGAAVALEEQDQRGLGRLVSVLPDPGALCIARVEGAGHRVAPARMHRAGVPLPGREAGSGLRPAGRWMRNGAAIAGWRVRR